MLFIVRTLELAYLRPAVLDDRLAVGVEIVRLGRAQVTLRQEVRRGEDALLRAQVNLACVGREGLRPRPLPEDIYAALAADARRELSKEA